MPWLNGLVAGLTVLSGARHLAAALSQPGDNLAVSLNDSDPFADYPPVIKARQQDDLDLRILPLGASIMSGVGSPEHSGLVHWPGEDRRIPLIGTAVSESGSAWR